METHYKKISYDLLHVVNKSMLPGKSSTSYESITDYSKFPNHNEEFSVSLRFVKMSLTNYAHGVCIDWIT